MWQRDLGQDLAYLRDHHSVTVLPQTTCSTLDLTLPQCLPATLNFGSVADSVPQELVCLLDDYELRTLGIGNEVAAARDARLQATQHP